MPDDWNPTEFKIGLNMAGAVSAGAYTAGVLDFLMEALEEWQTRKDAFLAYLAKPEGPAPPPVPLHDLKIEAFGGASAGGMCAAIASVMVQQPFSHIKTAQETGTDNIFYESWVNRINITELLQTKDLAGGKPLISLLDSTIIDDIAAWALTPKTPVDRAFISKRLTLMLTLTNVRGIPYQLYSDPDPNVDEFIEYYGDRLVFETTPHAAAPATSPVAKALPAGMPGAGAWPLLREAAKATGAFPLFLAPRAIPRDAADYNTPPWEPVGGQPGSVEVRPSFPSHFGSSFQTLNVDGGVTNNSPSQLVHDHLLAMDPKPAGSRNPREPLMADRAVLTVAPFPAKDAFKQDFDPQKAAALSQVAGTLARILISQSRFLGQSLEVLTSGESFSRFAIAPSDPGFAQDDVLQCGKLGAFGGFLDRGFRAHDFLLGRRNCQRFLLAAEAKQSHFSLPSGNSVIAAGLKRAGSYAPDIVREFGLNPPNPTVQPRDDAWMPLIPLCGSAREEVPAPPRRKIPRTAIDDIVNLATARVKYIKPELLKGAPGLARRGLRRPRLARGELAEKQTPRRPAGGPRDAGGRLMPCGDWHLCRVGTGTCVPCGHRCLSPSPPTRVATAPVDTADFSEPRRWGGLPVRAELQSCKVAQPMSGGHQRGISKLKDKSILRQICFAARLSECESLSAAQPPLFPAVVSAPAQGINVSEQEIINHGRRYQAVPGVRRDHQGGCHQVPLL